MELLCKSDEGECELLSEELLEEGDLLPQEAGRGVLDPSEGEEPSDEWSHSFCCTCCSASCDLPPSLPESEVLEGSEPVMSFRLINVKACETIILCNSFVSSFRAYIRSFLGGWMNLHMRVAKSKFARALLKIRMKPFQE